MALPHVPDAKDLIDIAFRQGRKAADLEYGKGRKITPEDKRINGELKRVQVAGKTISSSLLAVVSGFPSFDQMSPFHQELFRLQVDLDRYRQALARCQGVAKTVDDLKSKTIAQIKRQRDTSPATPFLGRLSSMVMRLDGELRWLVDVKHSIRNLPSVTDDPTVVIVGYPNVGKSTFLKTLTGSNVKTASYPFTTLSLLIGYHKKRYQKIQLIDSPGLLDRPMQERNRVELSAVAALSHVADVVLFIMDALQDVSVQARLLGEVVGAFDLPFVVAVNKGELSQQQVELMAGFELVYMDAREASSAQEIFLLCHQKIDEKNKK